MRLLKIVATIFAFAAFGGYAYADPVCDGTATTLPTTDDTAAIQTILDAGNIFNVPHAKLCKITQSLVITRNNSGLVGDGSGGLYMAAANFNNTSLAFSDRYGPHTVGIYAHGLLAAPWTPLVHPVIKGIRIVSEVQQGRSLSAVVVQNATQAKVSGNEIQGFPLGVGVRIQSCVLGCEVAENYIHDFVDNTTGWAVSSVPQITGIEVDNDVWNNVSSYQVIIRDNTIRNMLVGAAFLAAYGYQTDCINIARVTTYNTSITGNHLDTCAEGVDNFSIHAIINDNVVMNTYNFGIKNVHGASFVSVNDNTITNYGLAGIVVAGSSAAGDSNVVNIIVSGNNVSFGNYGGNWGGHDNAAILVGMNGTTSIPVNIFATGNILRPANGEYALNIMTNSGVTVSGNLSFSGTKGVSK